MKTTEQRRAELVARYGEEVVARIERLFDYWLVYGISESDKPLKGLFG